MCTTYNLPLTTVFALSVARLALSNNSPATIHHSRFYVKFASLIKEVTNEKDSKEESIAESVKVIEYTHLSKEKNVYEEQVLETH